MTIEERQLSEKEHFIFTVRTLTLIALAVLSYVYRDGGLLGTIRTFYMIAGVLFFAVCYVTKKSGEKLQKLCLLIFLAG